jgi:alpha-beta hydrolase superfamily lysophospholipase
VSAAPTAAPAAPPAPRIACTPASAHVRSARGELLPLRTWLPPGPPRRAVVALHGMVTHAGWFAQLGDLLAARDIALLAPDRRGNGLARALGGAGDAELLISDVAPVVQAARDLCDDVTLLSWCGSANFAVPAAARAPIRRFVLASPGLVPREAMAARFRAAVPIGGLLPIHFDPAADFTDDAEVQAAIRADELYLRWIPAEVRDAWRHLNPIARAALRALTIPTHGVLTRVDRMIDIPRTVELLAGLPIAWAGGGHGFLVEPAGARFVADLLAS